MIEAGKFVCPSCSKDSTIDNAIDVLDQELEEGGEEGGRKHHEDLCKKCGKCKCNDHDYSTCCKCSWSEIQKEFNNPLLYKRGSWCRWKYRPVILFEMCEEEDSTHCELCLDGYEIDENGYCVDVERCEEKENGICVKCKEDDSIVNGFYCANEVYGCLKTVNYGCKKCNDFNDLYSCTECKEGFYLNEQKRCIREEEPEEEDII